MPSFSLSPKNFTEKKKEVPGPGAYDPVSMERVPKWGMGTSTKEAGSFLSNAQKSPGPGAYEHRVKDTGPKWGFGASQRSKIAENGVPGPGQYKTLPMIGN